MKKTLKELFTPFGKVSKQTLLFISIIQISIVLFYWQNFTSVIFPKPLSILEDFIKIITSTSFVDDLYSSFILTMKATLYSIIIALLFSYLYLIPFFSSLSKFLVKCRFLTMTGLIFIFTLMVNNGGQLKIGLLILGIVPFFVTTMLGIIDSINKQEFENCWVLKFNNWQTLYEVVILGKLDQVLIVIKQNFAIAWLMITMVEGLAMGEGGLGTMMIKENKHLDLNMVFAIQLIIFIIGILFDYLFTVLRDLLFAYTKIETR